MNCSKLRELQGNLLFNIYQIKIKFYRMYPLLIYPENKKQLKVIKTLMDALNVRFEDSPYGNSPYNIEFVAKIKKGEQEFKDGKYTTVSLDDIWKLD
jgi:hypothetical protein